MLQCLPLKSSASTSSAAPPKINSPSPRRSQGGGGGTSSEASPNGALSEEYTLAFQTDSYNEIRSRIQEVEGEEDLESHHRLLLGQVLQPNRECVEEALRRARPSTLTALVSDYFEQSEKTAQVCLLLLHRSVYGARQLYGPLHQLLDVLIHHRHHHDEVKSLSLSQPQCSRALDVFLQFDRQSNPFACPADSHNFDHMRRCFSQLQGQLDLRLRSSRSRIRFLRRATVASALCLAGTAVGVVVSAAAIAVHALTAAALFVPFCCSGTSRTSSCMTAAEKKEVARMKQLDAAAKGTCVLNYELDTIDSLVRRLHTAVQGDKQSVRLVLERGNFTATATDKHPIQEVLKQLGKSHPNFIRLLDELENSIYLCFNTVNRARSLLLRHIFTLQSTDNVN